MLQCRHCPRRTLSDLSIARAMGWRHYVGTTQDGRELEDVVCPFCAGSKSLEDQPWDVGCHTCDWSFMGFDFEPGDTLLMSGQEAVALGREHRCEPDVWVENPDQETNRLYDLDKDGLPQKRTKA